MSGNGALDLDWIPDAVAKLGPLTMTFPEPPPEASAALLHSLGVGVAIDPLLERAHVTDSEGAVVKQLDSTDTLLRVKRNPEIEARRVSAGALAETPICKFPGCTLPDEGKGGPYAGKCAEHNEEQRRRRGYKPKGETDVPVTRKEGVPLVEGRPVSVEASVKDLVGLSRRVDTAIRKRNRARGDLISEREALAAIVAEFGDALAAVREAANELLK